MKYDLGQVIYFIIDNRFHSAPVLARMEIQNAHQDWAHTKEQKAVFTPFGDSGVFYATCHGIMREDDVYCSKQDMVNAIIGGA